MSGSRHFLTIGPRVVVYPFGTAPPVLGEGWLALPMLGSASPGASLTAPRSVSASAVVSSPVPSSARPGAVFGDGSHPTTRLCAAAVDLECRQRPGLAMLDVGTGTGILARIARARGASFVVGTDIDPLAVACSKAHAELDTATAIGATRAVDTATAADAAAAVGAAAAVDAAAADAANGAIHFGTEPPDHWGAHFDLVVANILEAPLHILAPSLCRALRPNGALLISGFTRPQAPALRLTYESAGLKSIGDFNSEGWVLLKFSAPPPPAHLSFT